MHVKKRQKKTNAGMHTEERRKTSQVTFECSTNYI